MRQRLLSPASPRQAYGSASPPRPSFISRWFSYGGNLKRFQRTPAERMLLRWVACWVMMAAVATIVMLFLLFQVNSYPILDKNLANIIRLQRKLTREGYSDTDEVSKTIIKAVSSKNIATTVRHLITGLHSGLHQDDLVKYVKKTWLKQGLDSVEEVSFKVLMSMPDPTNGNKSDTEQVL
ncbi:uncharacterized protein LOC135400495 [Ornithodoros turicata]|uniref:uncharacterized protein LOC135400495 n=1 Tax=Ornithodoros turicata TaxID=34597 RepID=UPI003138B9CD